MGLMLFIIFISGCGGNYHKRCAYKIPNNCSDSKNRSSTGQGNFTQAATMPNRPASSVYGLDAHQDTANALHQSNSLNDIPALRDRRATWSGALWSSTRPLTWNEKILASKIQVPHTFAVHSYKKPTMCQMCKKLVSYLLHLFYREPL